MASEDFRKSPLLHKLKNIVFLFCLPSTINLIIMKQSLAKIYNHLLYISTICLYLLTTQPLASQVTIKGQITDAQNAGIGQANILLLRASDSVMQKGTITANNGAYILEKIPDGQYLIRASATGFEDLYSSPIKIAGNDVDAGSLQLTKATIVMGGSNCDGP